MMKAVKNELVSNLNVFECNLVLCFSSLMLEFLSVLADDEVVDSKNCLLFLYQKRCPYGSVQTIN